MARNQLSLEEVKRRAELITYYLEWTIEDPTKAYNDLKAILLKGKCVAP